MSTEPQLWLSAAVSFGVTVILIHSFAPIARRIGLVDRPSERKKHLGSIPLVGGIAIYCGILFGLVMAGQPLGGLRGLVAGMGGLLLVGLLDDFRELSATARFLAQIAAALLMATWGGVRLEDFGMVIGENPLALGWASVPITVFCTVGVINAVNMIDGLDGLAGSLVLLCLCAVGFCWAVITDGAELALMIAASAAVIGFLLFNLRIGRRSGTVFLGDAGSQALGFLLAWLLIDGSQGQVRAFAPVTALWLLAVPLIDTVFVMIWRIRTGRSPFSSGRDHLHHLFLRSGFGAWSTLASMAGMAGLMIVIGLLLESAGVPETARFICFLAFCGAYYRVIGQAWEEGRWLGRTLGPEPGES